MSRVMIVEDDRDIGELMAYSLRIAGYDVFTVPEGEQAVAVAGIEHPDLILMDVRLPVMTGLEACTAIRARPDTARIPIVIISAKGMEREIRAGLDAGAAEYLVKPVLPGDLVSLARKYLEK